MINSDGHIGLGRPCEVFVAMGRSALPMKRRSLRRWDKKFASICIHERILFWEMLKVISASAMHLTFFDDPVNARI
jgi:hypothetical protein